MKNSGILLRFVTVVLLAGSCVSQTTSSAAQPDLARIQQVIQSQVDAKKFMGTVLLERDGKVLLDQRYGFADLEWNIPNSPTTKFRLGSVTKQFTAASILLL
jgi:CubicO group peptidase (beta-lactamase class C family)